LRSASAARHWLVALYALGGKIIPGLHFAFFDLNPGDEFARVREPIGYWNAVGILCVMAAPVCIWLAAFPEAAVRLRIGALLALTVLVLTTATTYSRGALLAYVAVLAVMVGAGPQRLRRLAVGVGAILAALPSIAVAFGLHNLSAGGLSLHDRARGGAILGLVLLLSLAAVAIAGRELLRIEGRVGWTPRHSRLVWRGLAAAVAGLLIVGVGALTVSSRGLTGQISHQADLFKQPKAGPGNDPSRLISSNGSNRWIWWQEALGAFSDKAVGRLGGGLVPGRPLPVPPLRRPGPLHPQRPAPVPLGDRVGRRSAGARWPGVAGCRGGGQGVEPRAASSARRDWRCWQPPPPGRSIRWSTGTGRSRR